MYCCSTGTKEVVQLMSKNVQIPLELLYDLCRVHLVGQDDKDTLERIQKALEGKLDAMVAHDTYSKSKDSNLTAQEREEARQKYLDLKGIHKDFRW